MNIVRQPRSRAGGCRRCAAAAPIGSRPKRIAVVPGAIPRRLTNAASRVAASRAVRTGIEIDRRCRHRGRRRRAHARAPPRWRARPKPWAPTAPAKTSASPVAPFSRSCRASALAAAGSGWSTRCMTVDHGAPGARAHHRLRVGHPAVERLDRRARHRSWRRAAVERRALEHVFDQLAPLLDAWPRETRPPAVARRALS